MSSSQDCQALVNLISNGQADPTLFPLQYQDVMATLGLRRWHTTATQITVTENTPFVQLTSDILNLIALIYDGRFLSLLELREVETLNPGWRNVTGTPIAYIEQAEAAQTVELYPAPYTTSPPEVTAIYAQNRSDSLLILTLPIALLVLKDEFSRQSDHVDLPFADLCGALGNMLLKMLESGENYL